MSAQISRLLLLSFAVVALLLPSCAKIPQKPLTENVLAYTVSGEDLLEIHAPIFVIDSPEKTYNLIGNPVPLDYGALNSRVHIDTDRAVYYAEKRTWQGEKGSYTNLYYRVHFPRIPMRFIPFHLGAGKNIGLFVIITLDADNRPLLYTTLHTCGCYLSFTATSNLDPSSFPPGWPEARRYLYGEYLPSRLDYDKAVGQILKLYILLRDGTHRVVDLWHDAVPPENIYTTNPATLSPLTELTQLPAPGDGYSSLFETEGPRKDYVKNSQKIWERLFISWWAFDWHVGEDKRLGRNTEDGVVFYTSLKPWARQASDLRDFENFLKYWGWYF